MHSLLYRLQLYEEMRLQSHGYHLHYNEVGSGSYDRLGYFNYLLTDKQLGSALGLASLRRH